MNKSMLLYDTISKYCMVASYCKRTSTKFHKTFLEDNFTNSLIKTHKLYLYTS